MADHGQFKERLLMLSPFLFVALVLRSWLLRYAEAFCFHWHFVDGSSNRSIPQVFEYFFRGNCPQQLQDLTVCCCVPFSE